MNYDKMVKEINDLGYRIKSADDIIKLNKNHKDVIPIIIKWIRKAEKVDDKEWLVRALGVEGFSEAVGFLLEEFNNSKDQLYKWAIGNSLYNIADRSFGEDYIDIIKNSEHGMSRQMIILLVGKLKIKKAIPNLLNLLKNNEEVGHVIKSLGFYEDVDAKLIDYIKPYLNHNKKWIRQEAKKTINKIKSKKT